MGPPGQVHPQKPLEFFMNIRRIFLFPVFTLIWLGLFLPLTVAAQSNPYFPLEPGLHHSYASEMDGSPDKFVTVTGSELLDGQQVWVLQWNYSDSSDFRLEFYSIAPDGDILFHGTRTRNATDDIVDYLANPPIRILDMPFTLGHTWTDPYVVDYYLNFTYESSIPGYTYNGEIIDTDSPITVPAGSFEALVVAGITLIDGGVFTQTTYSWYEMDVGVVRRGSSVDGVPGVELDLLYAAPLREETRSWGDVKALFR